MSFFGCNLSCNSLWTHPAFTEVSPALSTSPGRKAVIQTETTTARHLFRFALHFIDPTQRFDYRHHFAGDDSLLVRQPGAGCWALAASITESPVWELLRREAAEPSRSSLLSIPFQPQGCDGTSNYAVQLQGSDWRDSKLLLGTGCSQEEDEPSRAGWRNAAGQAHQNDSSVFPITTLFCHNTSNFKSNDPALERARSTGWLQTRGQLGPSC